MSRVSTEAGVALGGGEQTSRNSCIPSSSSSSSSSSSCSSCSGSGASSSSSEDGVAAPPRFAIFCLAAALSFLFSFNFLKSTPFSAASARRSLLFVTMVGGLAGRLCGRLRGGVVAEESLLSQRWQPRPKKSCELEKSPTFCRRVWLTAFLPLTPLLPDPASFLHECFPFFIPVDA